MTSQSAGPRDQAARVLIPLCGALALLPWISTAGGLIGGVLLARVLGNPYSPSPRRAAQLLLPGAIVCLGAGMDLRVIARVGAQAVGYTAPGIGLCLLLG